MEIKTEVKTFEVDMICDDCKRGKMRNNGICYPMNPPLYPHFCTNCNKQESYHFTYPYTTHEKINP